MAELRINKKNLKRGFSLVELIVASAVFIVVMVMSSSAVYTVFNSNQKSKNMRTVMDNLNLSLESMTRTIRFGKNYHCGLTGTPTDPLDCSNNAIGANSFSVTDSDGVLVTYSLVSGRIQRVRAGNTYYLTSPDVTISNLVFRVYGTAPYSSGANTLQPKVIIVIRGSVGTKASTASTFTIETTISQREIDFQ